MKIISTIHLKRLIVPCFLIVFIVGAILIKGYIGDNTIMTTQPDESSRIYFEPDKPDEGSLEEMYQDVFMTLLLPYVREAVTNYYEINAGYSPIVDPWQPKVLSIERPEGYRTFSFIIKLKVLPYLGAHNSIGVDHVTISVSSGKIRIEKFEHIESYPIPPHLQ